jgi:hypothetical protein
LRHFRESFGTPAAPRGKTQLLAFVDAELGIDPAHCARCNP